MSHWYEVFDNDRVQFITRKKAAKLIRILVAGLVISGLSLAIGFSFKPFLPLIISGVLILLFVIFWWITARLRTLRRVVWCVKISDRRIEAFDYTRKKITLDWTKVQRVELNTDGLTMFGPKFCALEIPHLFTDFSTLSHRIIGFSELYEIPVFVDGQPWQSIDVYTLFPFLEEGTSLN